jgi:hypothetical protein
VKHWIVREDDDLDLPRLQVCDCLLDVDHDTNGHPVPAEPLRPADLKASMARHPAGRRRHLDAVPDPKDTP